MDRDIRLFDRISNPIKVYGKKLLATWKCQFDHLEVTKSTLKPQKRMPTLLECNWDSRGSMPGCI